jgi:hypothetical protein
MPPDVRHLYEDAMRQALPALRDQDGNGVPDLFEGKGSGRARTFLSSRITVNGKTYRGVEEMPAEVRGTYEKVMASSRSTGASVNRNEINVSFGISKGPRPASEVATSFPLEATSPTLPTGLAPIEPRGTLSQGRVLWLFLVGLAAAALAFWIFTLRVP